MKRVTERNKTKVRKLSPGSAQKKADSFEEDTSLIDDISDQNKVLNDNDSIRTDTFPNVRKSESFEREVESTLRRIKTFEVKKRRQSVKENNYGVNSSTQNEEKKDRSSRGPEILIERETSESMESSSLTSDSCNVKSNDEETQATIQAPKRRVE